jgi:hypothetical protein
MPAALFGLAAALAFLATLENSAMAKTLASRSNQRVDPNQDMLALGAANLACAYFSGMSASCSLTRSALNYASGARTGLASMWNGLCCLIGALTLGGAVAYIPRAALATLVVCVAVSLFNKRHIFISSQRHALGRAGVCHHAARHADAATARRHFRRHRRFHRAVSAQSQPPVAGRVRVQRGRPPHRGARRADASIRRSRLCMSRASCFLPPPICSARRSSARARTPTCASSSCGSRTRVISTPPAPWPSRNSCARCVRTGVISSSAAW